MIKITVLGIWITSVSVCANTTDLKNLNPDMSVQNNQSSAAMSNQIASSVSTTPTMYDLQKVMTPYPFGFQSIYAQPSMYPAVYPYAFADVQRKAAPGAGFISGGIILTILVSVGISYWREEFGIRPKEDPIALLTGLAISGILSLIQIGMQHIQSF